jgi:hypothetical protein
MSDSPPPSTSPDAAPAAPEKLFTFRSGGWVVLLAFLFTLIAAALVLYPVYTTGGHRAVGNGRDVASYGFDLSNLALPPSALVASGNPKDGIRAIPEPLVETITPPEVDLIAKNEHIRFLVPSDRVIGVFLNGVARAYPVRVLALHELVNDTVGGVPIAVTWAPLCDSAVVFDRRIDGPAAPPAEFGHSGLFVSSNSVFFDRRPDPGQESLWPQLALRAVSGPAAGKAMTLIPYELVTWQQWTREHPDTRVLLGLRRLKKEYGSEPYNTYLHNDDVKFPVDPLWNTPGIPRKTRIIVTPAAPPAAPSPAPLHWSAQAAADASTRPAATSMAATSPPPLHTFLFAWYAQHPADTDYTPLTPTAPK